MAGPAAPIIRRETQLETAAGTIAQLTLEPADPVALVLLCPPFGLTMTDMFFPALHFVLNDVAVVRFDPLDHLGRSDGSIRNYTLAGVCRDLRAQLAELGHGTVVVGMSLAARSVIRVLTESPTAGAVLVTPVVHPRATLRAVTGTDWVEIHENAPELLPVTIPLLDHDVASTSVEIDHGAGLMNFSEVLRDAEAIEVPTAVLAAGADGWVDFGEVQDFCARGGSDLTVIKGVGHKYLLNPRATQQVFSAATAQVLAMAGCGNRTVVTPRFRDAIKMRRELS